MVVGVQELVREGVIDLLLGRQVVVADDHAVWGAEAAADLHVAVLHADEALADGAARLQHRGRALLLQQS